jgi:hypothetical protein
MAENESGYDKMQTYRAAIQRALDTRDFSEVARMVAIAEGEGYILDLLLGSIVQPPPLGSSFALVDATAYCAGIQRGCN